MWSIIIMLPLETNPAVMLQNEKKNYWLTECQITSYWQYLSIKLSEMWQISTFIMFQYPSSKCVITLSLFQTVNELMVTSQATSFQYVQHSLVTFFRYRFAMQVIHLWHCYTATLMHTCRQIGVNLQEIYQICAIGLQNFKFSSTKRPLTFDSVFCKRRKNPVTFHFR